MIRALIALSLLAILSCPAEARRKKVVLRWTASAGATTYDVYRSQAHNGPYQFFSATPLRTYTDGSVMPNRTYFYVVVAIGPTGQSKNSNEYKAVITP